MWERLRRAKAQEEAQKAKAQKKDVVGSILRSMRVKPPAMVQPVDTDSTYDSNPDQSMLHHVFRNLRALSADQGSKVELDSDSLEVTEASKVQSLTTPKQTAVAPKAAQVADVLAVQPLQPTADDSRSTVGQTVDSLDSYRKQQEAAGHKMSVMQMAELAMQRTKKKEAARAAARAKVQEAKVQETKKIQAQQAAKKYKRWIKPGSYHHQGTG